MKLFLIYTLLFTTRHARATLIKGVPGSLIDNDTPRAYGANLTQIASRDSGFVLRQEEGTCTLPEPWFPCPDGVTCCSTSDNCIGDGLCCPQTAETCGKNFCLEPGDICCGDGACIAGAACLEASDGESICCPAEGYFACPDKSCCPDGSTCAGDGFCEDDGEETTSTRSTTSTSSKSSSTAKPTLSETESISTTKVSESSESTVTRTIASSKVTTRATTSTTSEISTAKMSSTSNGCAATAAAHRRNLAPGLAKRLTASPTGPNDPEWTQVNGQCVPVIDFFCVEDLFNQLCMSMCKGIRDQSSGIRRTDVSSTAQVLSSTAILLSRRNGRNEAPGIGLSGDGTLVCAQREDSKGVPMQSDEFPPASTLEGGGPTRTCISRIQNGLGGTWLKLWYSNFGLVQGDKFVIRMDTCDLPDAPPNFPLGTFQSSSAAPTPRLKNRDDASNVTSTSSLANYFSIPKESDESNVPLGLIIMPLTNATAGQYSGQLTLTEVTGLSDISILDSSGTSYWEQDGDVKSTNSILNYTLPEDMDDLFLAAVASTSVSVSATVSATGHALAATPKSTGSCLKPGILYLAGLLFLFCFGY